MKRQKRRDIITRSFVMSGNDGVDGLVEYIDMLEGTVVSAHKQLLHRNRRVSLNHYGIHKALTEISQELGYSSLTIKDDK